MSEDRLDDELAHAPLGPSAAARWTICPGSVKASEGLPDETSEPAAEGTAAHHISEMCLAHGFDADDFLGMVSRVEGYTFAWGEEDARLLQYGINQVREMVAAGGEFFGERRVDISPWTLPGQFGTLDRAVILRVDGTWWVYVTDLKWGRWPVYAHENKQVILYALGLWNDVLRHRIGADEEVRFVLSIDQPRAAGGGGSWEVDMATLLRWGDWFRERAIATQVEGAPFVASSEGCAFCRVRVAANGGCATYETFNRQLIQSKFDEEGAVVENARLTPEQRSRILGNRKMLETWLDQLEEEELADYLAGRPTPGRKGVIDTQKGTRDKWKNEAEADAVLAPILGDKRLTKKLITPIQAGKQIGREHLVLIEPHIQRGEKGRSMVPLEDARLPIPVVLFDEESAEIAETGEIEP